KIAFDAVVGGNADVYVIGASGGLLQRVTDAPSEDVVPASAPDGRWLYFASDRSGASQIWRISADPEEPADPAAVTVDGGFYPSVSPDGMFLYFVKDRAVETSLWRMPLAGGEVEEVIPALRAGWA